MSVTTSGTLSISGSPEIGTIHWPTKTELPPLKKPHLNLLRQALSKSNKVGLQPPPPAAPTSASITLTSADTTNSCVVSKHDASKVSQMQLSILSFCAKFCCLFLFLPKGECSFFDREFAKSGSYKLLYILLFYFRTIMKKYSKMFKDV